MKTSKLFLALVTVGSLALSAVLALPAAAQTATPLTVAKDTTTPLCAVTALAGTCGTIYKGSADESANGRYQFQLTAGTGAIAIKVSLDGTVYETKRVLDHLGDSWDMAACGPCYIKPVVTKYTSGTLTLTAALSGSLAMRMLPTVTPTPTLTPTNTPTRTPTRTPTPTVTP